MVQEINVYLGRRLRRRRLLLGLSQSTVAIAVGVRFQQIQKYECAANAMSAARLWQLSEALHVPVSYFFDGLHTVVDRPASSPSKADGARFVGEET